MLNSQYMRTQKAAHAKALHAPMTYLPMEGDAIFTVLQEQLALPGFDDGAGMAPGRAQLERRACQYAQFMLRKAHRVDPSHYAAIFDGVDTITFTCVEEIPLCVVIPKHIMEFDVEAPAIAHGPPESAPPETLSLL